MMYEIVCQAMIITLIIIIFIFLVFGLIMASILMYKTIKEELK
jgi:hypothetical protein